MAFFACMKIIFGGLELFCTLAETKSKNMKTNENKSDQFINDQIAESVKEWCLRNQESLSKKTDTEIQIEKYKDLIKREERMIYEQQLETVTKWENRFKESETEFIYNKVSGVQELVFCVSLIQTILLVVILVFK